MSVASRSSSVLRSISLPKETTWSMRSARFSRVRVTACFMRSKKPVFLSSSRLPKRVWIIRATNSDYTGYGRTGTQPSRAQSGPVAGLCEGDPSLRLKNSYVQDDAPVEIDLDAGSLQGGGVGGDC